MALEMTKPQSELDAEEYIEKRMELCEGPCLENRKYEEYWQCAEHFNREALMIAGARAVLAWCEKNAEWDNTDGRIVYIHKIKKEYFEEG